LAHVLQQERTCDTMLAPQRFTAHGPVGSMDGFSAVGLSHHSKVADPQITSLVGAPVHERHGQPQVVLAAMVVPVVVTLVLRATWRPMRGSQLLAARRVVRCAVTAEQTTTETETETETQAETKAETQTQTKPKKKKRRLIPSRAYEATLKARIWDHLGLRHDSGKEEIRKAYREFVRLSHPDLNNGARRDEEKFERVTTAYNEAMGWTKEEFFLQSYDCGITRMATKRVDGPSLNPWERRFRQWARSEGLLEVDELEEDADARKRAEFYLAACEEDPTDEECDVEAMQEAKDLLGQGQEDAEDGYNAKAKRGQVPQILLGFGALIAFFILFAAVFLGLFFALGGAGPRES